MVPSRSEEDIPLHSSSGEASGDQLSAHREGWRVEDGSDASSDRRTSPPRDGQTAPYSGKAGWWAFNSLSFDDDDAASEDSTRPFCKNALTEYLSDLNFSEVEGGKDAADGAPPPILQADHNLNTEESSFRNSLRNRPRIWGVEASRVNGRDDILKAVLPKLFWQSSVPDTGDVELVASKHTRSKGGVMRMKARLRRARESADAECGARNCAGCTHCVDFSE